MRRTFNAKRLRDVRQGLGLTLEAVALLTGLEVPAISTYETGRRSPGGRALVELCRGLSSASRRAGLPPLHPWDLFDTTPELPPDQVDGWLIATRKGA